jgi:peptidoglycan hydrolase-like protein with peptidoglycan-binding domain
MVRSYTILAAALLGIAALAIVVRLTRPGGDDQAFAATRGNAVVTTDVPDRSDIIVDDALAGDVREQLGLDPSVLPECPLTRPLRVGDEHPDVACLESQLIDAGVLVSVSPDERFDEATDTAVRSFQQQNDLVVDGVVGSRTASLLGSWAGPAALPPDSDTCPDQGRAAMIDRFNQRAWLCDDGSVAEVMPMTSALSQPDPGSYEVYAKELVGSSTIGGDYSEMTHFVAFSHGRNQGARIAFHSVPTHPGGAFVQPLESVGSAEFHGASAGCIRVLPADAELIWSWLDIGDAVTVVT